MKVNTHSIKKRIDLYFILIMDLELALLVYLILVIIVYFLSRNFLRITIWSSIVLSLVIGVIFLSALCPISSVEKVMEQSVALSLYIVIVVFTILLAIFYILERALRDIDRSSRTGCPMKQVLYDLDSS